MHNAVRGLFVGGYAWPEFASVNVIDYITMDTLGDAVDFGDATTAVSYQFGTSNGPRGVYGGGSQSGITNYSDVIEYVTMDTTGNGADFGDLNTTRSGIAASACSGN